MTEKQEMKDLVPDTADLNEAEQEVASQIAALVQSKTATERMVYQLFHDVDDTRKGVMYEKIMEILKSEGEVPTTAEIQ